MLGKMLAGAISNQIAQDLIDKAGEILFGEKTKDIVQGLQERIRAHNAKLPRNHDLERAIRCAEITASIAVIEHFWRRSRYEQRSIEKPPFIDQALNVLRSRIGLCPTLTVMPDDDIVAEIDECLDEAQTSNSPAKVEGLTNVACATWDSLVAETSDDPPPDLKDYYLGRLDPGVSWALFFIALIREQIKEKPRANIAYSLSRHASALVRLKNLEASSQEIKSQNSAILHKVDVIFDIVQSGRRSHFEERLRRHKLQHSGGLWSAVFSPDGQKIITASGSGLVTIWIAEDRGYTGFQTAGDPKDDATYAAFSPSGKFFAASWWNGMVVHWHASQPFEQILQVEHPAVVSCLAYSPDDRRLAASGRDGTVSVWEISSGDLLLSIVPDQRKAPINSVQFSPFGDTFVTSDSVSGAIQIWDVSTGVILASVLGHADGAGSASFSKDGTMIVSTGIADCRIKIWNAADLSPVLVESDGFKHNDIVWSAEFSRDGRRIVSASDDKKAIIWNLSTGSRDCELAHPRSIITASFSADGTKVVTACYNGCAYVWDLALP